MKKQLLPFFILLFLSAKAATPPTQKDKNIPVATAYFDLLFKKGDFAAIEKMLAPDAVYSQAAGLPYGGVYTGFSAWMGMFGKFPQYLGLEMIGNPVFFSNTDKNQVIAVFSVKFKAKKSGNELIMEISELLEFNNGKIQKITPFYFDTKSLVDLINAQ